MIVSACRADFPKGQSAHFPALEVRCDWSTLIAARFSSADVRWGGVRDESKECPRRRLLNRGITAVFYSLYIYRTKRGRLFVPLCTERNEAVKS